MKKAFTVVPLVIVLMLVMCSCSTIFVGKDSRDGNNQKTLEMALMDNNYQGVLDIVEKDSKYASMKLDYTYPLNLAAYMGNADLCKYLLSKGASPEGAAFMEVENIDIIELLIQKGGNLNEKEDGETALGRLFSEMDIFSENELGPVADKLLDAGADMDSESFDYMLEAASDCTRVQSLVRE